MTPPAIQPCVILAGGLGTRLRDEIGELPKCLAPVGATHFLDVQLKMLSKQGVTDVVLALGYRARAVIDAVAVCNQPIRIHLVVENMPLGTGGAIANALDQVGWDEALVVNGDTYLDAPFGAMLKKLDSAKDEVCRIAIYNVPDRGRFGGVELDDCSRVLRFSEKGQSGPGAINAGLYRIARTALPIVVGNAYSLELDILPWLASQRRIKTVSIGGRFIDIGVPQDYKMFCEEYER